MRSARPLSDLDQAHVRPFFAPRLTPGVIPSSSILAEPAYCLRVNAAWLGHVLGVLDALDQPDAWRGTATEIEDARNEVRKLIASIDPECPSVMGITNVRVNNCILEAEFSDNPGVWVQVGDLSACAIEGPEGPQGLPGLPGEDGSDGLDGASPEMRLSGEYVQWRQDDDDPTWTNLFHIPSWVPDCCDDPMLETPGEDGPDKRCNIASFFVEEVLPQTVETLLAESEQGTDIGTLALIFVGLGLSIAITGSPFVGIGLLGASAGMELATLVVSINANDVRASLDFLFWDEVRCIIYSHLPESGIMDNTTKNAIADEIDAIPTGNQAGELTAKALKNMTREAIDFFCSYGTQHEGNCSTCEPDWCHTFDFTQSNGGWQPVTTETGPRGIYYAGQGWSNGTNRTDHYGEVRIYKSFAATAIRTVKVWYSSCASVDAAFVAELDGSPSQFASALASPISYTFEHTVTSLRVDTTITQDTNRCLYLTQVEICGNGTNPFEGGT